MSSTGSSRASTPPAPAATPFEKIKTLAQLYQEGVLKSAEKEGSDEVKEPSEAIAGYLDRVSLFQGDITKLDVDAIVNAANKSLLGGGGVDGAIHVAAGPKLLDECRQLNGCLTGQSKITRGYRLPARHVIHTVGPVYSSSDVKARAKQLASCYKTTLQVAVEYSIKHVAFPSISTGIYGYPIEDATRIALGVVRDFCGSEDGKKLDRIIFVVWSDGDKGVYEKLIPEYFPPSPPAPGAAVAAASSEEGQAAEAAGESGADATAPSKEEEDATATSESAEAVKADA